MHTIDRNKQSDCFHLWRRWKGRWQTAAKPWRPQKLAGIPSTTSPSDFNFLTRKTTYKGAVGEKHCFHVQQLPLQRTPTEHLPPTPLPGVFWMLDGYFAQGIQRTGETGEDLIFLILLLFILLRLVCFCPCHSQYKNFLEISLNLRLQENLYPRFNIFQ